MVVVVATLFLTGVAGFGYCGAMFLGFVPQLWSHPWVDLGVLTAIYLLVHEGLWSSLARFPWPTEGVQVDWNPELRGEKATGPSCGWPHDRFHRDIRAAQGIAPADALLISMLAGWWVYSLESWIPDPLLHPLSLNVMVLAAFRRFWIYRVGYAPPISLAGRLATLRWVIPGYDLVYLALLLAILGMTLGLVLGRAVGLGPRGGFPLAMFLSIFATLAAPPSLKRWRLTGRHRLVHALSEQTRTHLKVG
jgi:hypothetical protein